MVSWRDSGDDDANIRSIDSIGRTRQTSQVRMLQQKSMKTLGLIEELCGNEHASVSPRQRPEVQEEVNEKKGLKAMKRLTKDSPIDFRAILSRVGTDTKDINSAPVYHHLTERFKESRGAWWRSSVDPGKGEFLTKRSLMHYRTEAARRADMGKIDWLQERAIKRRNEQAEYADMLLKEETKEEVEAAWLHALDAHRYERELHMGDVAVEYEEVAMVGERTRRWQRADAVCSAVEMFRTGFLTHSIRNRESRPDELYASKAESLYQSEDYVDTVFFPDLYLTDGEPEGPNMASALDAVNQSFEQASSALSYVSQVVGLGGKDVDIKVFKPGMRLVQVEQAIFRLMTSTPAEVQQALQQLALLISEERILKLRAFLGGAPIDEPSEDCQPGCPAFDESFEARRGSSVTYWHPRVLLAVIDLASRPRFFDDFGVVGETARVMCAACSGNTLVAFEWKKLAVAHGALLLILKSFNAQVDAISSVKDAAAKRARGATGVASLSKDKARQDFEATKLELAFSGVLIEDNETLQDVATGIHDIAHFVGDWALTAVNAVATGGGTNTGSPRLVPGAEEEIDGNYFALSCKALMVLCTGYDETTHERRAIAIDQQALESVIEATKLVAADADAVIMILEVVKMLWTDMHTHYFPGEAEKSYISDEEMNAKGYGFAAGRQRRAIQRVSLGVSQFDAICNIVRGEVGLQMRNSQVLPGLMMQTLTLLLPALLYSAPNRVACIVRARVMQSVIKRCLEALPDSVRDSAENRKLEEKLTEGYLSLHIKAALKRAGTRMMRKSLGR